MSAQGLQQVQRQTQSLVLAPHLRQSLKILQVAALELRNVVQEELATNPTLEDLPPDTVSVENPTGEAQPVDESFEREEMTFAEDFAVLQKIDEDFREHFQQNASPGEYSAEDAERRQHLFDSLTGETSLQEYLLGQARLSDASPALLEALEYLVGSLDDRGFLTASLSDLALQSQLPLGIIQEASTLLRSLDPPGIGATSLQDCLLLQLRLKNRTHSDAARIISECFDLLIRRRVPEIARQLGIAPDGVQDAIEEISNLDPTPGRRFREDTNHSVVPDVTVYKDDGEWIVRLNGDYVPRLRLSQTYKDLLAKGTLNRAEKAYLHEKMRSGKLLIGAIEQRQQTIERLTREILRCQIDFFEEGVGQLRPLTMNQVAASLGVHETTISRAIAGKYIDTPHGLFPLKYFFTPGFTATDGQSLSNTSIKDTIARLIESENPSKPLSDQDLVALLAERQLTIARRTVAKYREELGILPTHLRRRFDSSAR